MGDDVDHDDAPDDASSSIRSHVNKDENVMRLQLMPPNLLHPTSQQIGLNDDIDHDNEEDDEPESPTVSVPILPGKKKMMILPVLILMMITPKVRQSFIPSLTEKKITLLLVSNCANILVQKEESVRRLNSTLNSTLLPHSLILVSTKKKM